MSAERSRAREWWSSCEILGDTLVPGDLNTDATSDPVRVPGLQIDMASDTNPMAYEADTGVVLGRRPRCCWRAASWANGCRECRWQGWSARWWGWR